ncbi:hypothetical protein [Actinomycetospora soli]|uniref:hypothetical protein n=1 Tax=Actinomycetospora soli TaxID=2893887 RepID=UPI001E390D96|nr:hypothetical protein [Actinomycetospora soli]MCD2191631.1 hypothetical protein [Actinomycetospora soli]
MQWVVEPAALDWVNERVSEFSANQVSSLVPSGFEAYARISHPHRVESAAVLVEVLRSYTGAGERCWFASWEGYGWVWGGIVTFSTDPATHGLSPEPDELPVPAKVRDGPRARRPHRGYVLYTGGLGDALVLGDLDYPWRHRTPIPAITTEVPDLWWPESRAWFVASDTDLEHCTYLGGTRVLVDQVVAEPRLDATPVDPCDPLL